MINDLGLYNIDKRPVISEKSMTYQSENVYAFFVNINANKYQIKDAIESIFEVKVESIRTVKVPAKKKKVRYKEGLTAVRKKAYVKLLEGYEIKDFVEV